MASPPEKKNGELLEEREAGPEPLNVFGQAAKKYRLGVLLVHGIGTQPSGEVLFRWGDALIKTIGRATRGRVRATVGLADRDDRREPEGRAEAFVRLEADEHQERWLLSEGWWDGTPADKMKPPPPLQTPAADFVHDSLPPPMRGGVTRHGKPMVAGRIHEVTGDRMVDRTLPTADTTADVTTLKGGGLDRAALASLWPGPRSLRY